MEKDLFLHYQQSPWQSMSSAMEIPSSTHSPDPFFNPNWDNSTDQCVNFDSTLPVGSSNESSVIRELIGKLGSIGNSTNEMLHYMNGNHSTNTSSYTTPLNSPVKLNLHNNIDHLVRENLSSFGNSIPLHSDQGLVERAARLSCFGSRSFNGRASQLGGGNCNSPLIENGKLGRVSSSPSLKALGSQMGVCENHDFDESSVSGKVIKGSKELNSRKRKGISRGYPKEDALSQCKLAKVSEPNEDSNLKRSKGMQSENCLVQAEEEPTKTNEKPPEPPKDYIHVRARRGQATDSHSLAERVRREKISERMKLLQDLVPGCNKVTGKALMLDEIINYVQSLQRQVEFLSMKLASVDTSIDVNMETLVQKNMFPSNNSLSQAMYAHQAQQSLQSNGSNGSLTHCLADKVDTTLRRNLSLHLPSHVGGFTENIPQVATFCEDDLQSIIQMGFSQNQTGAECQSQASLGQTRKPT